MRKYILFTVILSSLAVAGFGQQLFTSSLFDMQGNFHNPSVAGSAKHTMVGATYRTMWDGISGGPRTATVLQEEFSMGAPLPLRHAQRLSCELDSQAWRAVGC